MDSDLKKIIVPIVAAIIAPPPEPPLILGQKAIAILRAASLNVRDVDGRCLVFQDVEHQFGAKALRRKVEELTSRGYLDWEGVKPSQASLTDKGRKALEHHVIRP